jgi:hypothetical protein
MLTLSKLTMCVCERHKEREREREREKEIEIENEKTKRKTQVPKNLDLSENFHPLILTIKPPGLTPHVAQLICKILIIQH